MSQPRRKYDPEFKAGAVRIVRETRRPIAEIAPRARHRRGGLGELGPQGRSHKRWRRGLTRPDKAAAVVPDLLGRDFTAERADRKWVGDFKQVETDEGPVFLATVEDLFSRRMLGYATSDAYPTAQFATAAINMAAAVRGGDVVGVIFHTDKGSQHTSIAFAEAWCRLGVTQSMGRVGCALDNACAESFFSTLEDELVSRAATRPETKPGETSPPGSTPGTTGDGSTRPTT